MLILITTVLRYQRSRTRCNYIRLADSDGDGLNDVFEGASATDGFDVNDENLDPTDTNFALPDSDNDTAADGSDAVPLTNDLDYRDNDAPPIIDLNSTADAGDANRNYSDTFTEGDTPVNVADNANADVSDLGDNDLVSLTITAASLSDGDSEIVTLGGTSFPLATDVTTPVTVTVGTTTFNVTYDSTTGIFSLVDSDTGNPVIPQADLDTLIQGITYENTSGDPTKGDRTLGFDITIVM